MRSRSWLCLVTIVICCSLAGLETSGSLLFFLFCVICLMNTYGSINLPLSNIRGFLSCPTNVCPVKAKAGAPDGLGIKIVSLFIQLEELTGPLVLAAVDAIFPQVAFGAAAFLE